MLEGGRRSVKYPLDWEGILTLKNKESYSLPFTQSFIQGNLPMRKNQADGPGGTQTFSVPIFHSYFPPSLDLDAQLFWRKGHGDEATRQLSKMGPSVCQRALPITWSGDFFVPIVSTNYLKWHLLSVHHFKEVQKTPSHISLKDIHSPPRIWNM